MTVVILVADGARPDVLSAAMAAGRLPALEALCADGAAHVVTSVFPSTTGPAYVPFLMGIHPGEAGVPGIRWLDRAGGIAWAPRNARSYVGAEALLQDGDLARAHPTLFELAPMSLAALSPIGRGLAPGARLGASARWWPRLAWTHFRGDLAGWLRLERDLAGEFAARVDGEQPALAFFAHPGIDKLSHALGPDAPEVLDAYGNVDALVARLRRDAACRGRPLDLIIVSDHGHEPVARHDDLAQAVRDLGYGVLAHPWTFAGGDEVAVMVSGNAMAQLYLDPDTRERRWWPRLARRWERLADAMLAREAVELLLLPHAPHVCEVRSRAHGSAFVTREADGTLAYRPERGDPLRLAAAVGGSGAIDGLTDHEAWEATRDTPFPDSLVQVLALGGASRAGDLLLSAADGWDLRARWEPIPHRSTHGALRAAQMLVPLLTSFALPSAPRTTADVFGLARERLVSRPTR